MNKLSPVLTKRLITLLLILAFVLNPAGILFPLPTVYGAPSAASTVTGAETTPAGSLEKDPVMEVYNKWMKTGGGGKEATLPDNVMIEMYKAAGNDEHAFKHIAKLIAEGHIVNNHSVDMAKMRDAWVEKLLFEMAKEKGYQIARSDSGNQTSGMKSDLDQTIYVFKMEDGVPVRIDVEADEAFIKEFNERFAAASGGISLDALDLASIAGGNRFPDGRDTQITEYFKEFERTTKQLRATPGAYTYQGAVLQQMQFRALDAILKANPRAFRIYSPDGSRQPPDNAKDWTEDQWEEWRHRAIKDMFGIEPQLMKGHAFGASMANWYELQHYLDIEKKFESKYHLRTWEDGMFVLLLENVEEGRRGKREYADLPEEKKKRYNRLIMQRLFPNDPVMQRKHILAMEVSLQLRRLHKATDNEALAKMFGGTAITDPKEQKRAIFGRLALELYPEQFGYDPNKEYSPEEIKAFLTKVTDADLLQAEKGHRHVASEFCLESVYHTSIDAFELLVDPKRTETFIRKFNHLQRKHRNQQAIAGETSRAEADLKQAEDDIKKHQAEYDEANKKLSEGNRKKGPEHFEILRKRNKAKFLLTQAQNKAREARRVNEALDKERTELEIFNRLTRDYGTEITDANRDEFLKRLADGVHISLIYAIHDLGPARSPELIRRLNERFPGHELRIEEILKQSGRIGNSPSGDPNNALRDGGAAGADSESIMTKLLNRVRDYVFDDLKIGPEKETAVDLAVKNQRLVWHWRDYAHDKFNDEGTLDLLGSILVNIMENEGDLAPVTQNILSTLSTELPVYGQLVDIAGGGAESAAWMALAMVVPPVGQMMFVYSLGSSAYAIYDLEFGQPSRANAEDAVYRGFYGPELFNFDNNMIVPMPDEYRREAEAVTMEIHATHEAWFKAGGAKLGDAERELKNSEEMGLKEKDREAWRKLFTETRKLRLLKMDRDQKIAALEIKRQQLVEMQKQSEAFLRDKSVWHWQGGSYSQKFLLGLEGMLASAGIDAAGLAAQAPGAQLEQKPFELHALKDVQTIIGFFQAHDGFVDFEAKDESAKIPALEKKRDGSFDIAEKLTLDAEIQEIRLQAERAKRAKAYLEAAAKNHELMYKIKRDSVYPNVLRRGMQDASLLSGERFITAWLEKNKPALIELLVANNLMALPYGVKREGDKFIQDYQNPETGQINKNEISIGFPFDEQSLKDRLDADYARSKQMWEEKEKREDERKKAAEKNLKEAIDHFKAQAVGMMAEKEAANPLAREFYNSLIYSAIQRSRPKVKAMVNLVEIESEDKKAEKKYDVGVLVNIKADPTVYKAPYEIKAHHMNKAEAEAALKSKNVNGAPLDESSLGKLSTAIGQAKDNTLISVISVFAAEVLDASSIIFPETLQSGETPAAPKEEKGAPNFSGGVGSLVGSLLSNSLNKSGSFGAPVAATTGVNLFMGHDIAVSEAEESAPSGDLVLEGARNAWRDTISGGMPDQIAGGSFVFYSEAVKNLKPTQKVFFQLLWAPKKDGPWNVVDTGWKENYIWMDRDHQKKDRYRLLNWGGVGHLTRPKNEKGEETDLVPETMDGKMSISAGQIKREEWPKNSGPYFRLREAVRGVGENAPKKDAEWTTISNILEPQYDILFINSYGRYYASDFESGKVPDYIDPSKENTDIYDEAHGAWPDDQYGLKSFHLTLGAKNMPIIVQPDGPVTVTSQVGTLTFWMNKFIPENSKPENDNESAGGPGHQHFGAIPIVIPRLMPGQTLPLTVSTSFRGQGYSKTFTVHGPKLDPRAQAEISALETEYAVLQKAVSPPQSRFPTDEAFFAYEKDVDARYSKIYAAFTQDPASNGAAFVGIFKEKAEHQVEKAARAKWTGKQKLDQEIANKQNEAARFPYKHDEMMRGIELAKKNYAHSVATNHLAAIKGLMSNRVAVGDYGKAFSHYQEHIAAVNQYEGQKVFSEAELLEKRSSGHSLRAGSTKFDKSGGSTQSLLRHLALGTMSPQPWQEMMDLKKKREEARDGYDPKKWYNTLDPEDYAYLAHLTAIRYGDGGQATQFFFKGVEISKARRALNPPQPTDKKNTYIYVPGWLMIDSNIKPKEVTEGIELTPEMKAKDDWVQKLESHTADTSYTDTGASYEAPQANPVTTPGVNEPLPLNPAGHPLPAIPTLPAQSAANASPSFGEEGSAPAGSSMPVNPSSMDSVPPPTAIAPAAATPAQSNPVPVQPNQIGTVVNHAEKFFPTSLPVADEGMKTLQYDQARPLYANHLAANPNDTAVLMNAAKIKALDNDLDGAIQNLMKVLASSKGRANDPLQTAAQHELVSLFIAKRDFQSAAAWNDRAIKADPSDALALSYRGSIFEGEVKNPAVIQAAFNAANAKQNTIGWDRYDEGLFYYDHRDYSRALVDFAAATKLLSQNAAAVYMLARCYAQLGRNADANQYYTAHQTGEADPLWRSRSAYELQNVMAGRGAGPYLTPAPAGTGNFGLSARNVTALYARQNGLARAEGVHITRLDAAAAPAKSGLQAGDIVVSLNDSRILNSEHFAELVVPIPPGASVKMNIIRSGQPVTLQFVV